MEKDVATFLALISLFIKQIKKIRNMKKLIILTTTLFIFALSFNACIKDTFCVRGEGDIVTENLDLDPFTRFNSMGAEKVIVTQGATQSVRAEGHENIIERLETEVINGEWDISLEREFCYADYDLTIYITVPNIEGISITGSADIVVNDFVDQEELELNISGSGDVEFNDFLQCSLLDIEISGSGEIHCNGEFDNLETLNIKISGSGDLNAYRAETENCNINISGSGNCEVTVNQTLDVSITGSGDIHYKGEPTIDTHISGSGHLYNEN